MPELPDVELFRRVLERHGLRRRIGRVDLRDGKRLRHADAGDLREAFEGKTLGEARRHGKIVFAGTKGGGDWLVMHFGMTGALVAYDDEDDEPRHARLVLSFADRTHVAFDNMRKFGWLELAKDPQEYLEREDIGPDALAIDRKTFGERVGNSGGAVKAALMDQKKIAGIGNVYSDEIMFQTRTRPDRKAKELCEDRVDAIFDTMRSVLRTTIELDADRGRMPEGWLAPTRTKDTDCPRCGRAIETKTVGGRTAFFCSACQS